MISFAQVALEDFRDMKIRRGNMGIRGLVWVRPLYFPLNHEVCRKQVSGAREARSTDRLFRATWWHFVTSENCREREALTCRGMVRLWVR